MTTGLLAVGAICILVAGLLLQLEMQHRRRRMLADVRATNARIKPPVKPPVLPLVHQCGEGCATWFIAQLTSVAKSAPHECNHARRKAGRCPRRGSV